MGILLSKETRVVVQGITGNEGTFWTERMLAAGTNIVGGVTPGKGGAVVHGVPVYNTVREVVDKHGAEASVIFVPPPFAKDATFEALEAGLKLVVLLVDGLPVQDAMEVRTYAKETGAYVIGPNNPGMATIGEAMLGFIPVWLSYVYQPGNIGVVARSGSLINEVCSHIVAAGLGISTCIGLGGDPVPGTTLTEVLDLFQKDEHTKGIVIIGEVGGSMEEDAAEFMKAGGFTKPAVAFIAGRSAPPGKKMGHAGAIMTLGRGSVQSKESALSSAGVKIAQRPSEVGRLLLEAMA
ncbi:succinate--CoA ligase subunit alpha [Neomoorella humiferrea]|uniref:Succinyl-CoA ligase [ADP-forming] subunit alpha n=1 Tax=Neomoorella humiferrea TaxID=676965 RepID=A0A2T0ARM7_9FIRM|nr:succinate--CoA ligase subunit alpha [Moorella humiferrea]PRR72501.1 Succinyl-CoA ligase [ADP-forming] subunit alpha [Moorella humiferrea]